MYHGNKWWDSWLVIALAALAAVTVVPGLIGFALAYFLLGC